MVVIVGVRIGALHRARLSRRRRRLRATPDLLERVKLLLAGQEMRRAQEAEPEAAVGACGELPSGLMAQLIDLTNDRRPSGERQLLGPTTWG